MSHFAILDSMHAFHMGILLNTNPRTLTTKGRKKERKKEGMEGRTEEKKEKEKEQWM